MSASVNSVSLFVATSESNPLEKVRFCKRNIGRRSGWPNQKHVKAGRILRIQLGQNLWKTGQLCIFEKY